MSVSFNALKTLTPVNSLKTLMLAGFSLTLAACASDPNDISHLNATLPNFKQSDVLPKVSANQYCKPNLDGDLLYGMGYRFYRQRKLSDAQTCLAMAAPEFPQSFCYLSNIAENSTNLTQEQKQQAMFRYTAFAATKNQSCAEYQLHLAYAGDPNAKDLDVKPQAKRAFLWLERAAIHGDPLSQAKVAETYEKAMNKPIEALAWVRIFNLDSEIEVLDKDAIKLDEKHLEDALTEAQRQESDAVFLQNLARVKYKKDVYAEDLRYKNAFYSGSVYLEAPDAMLSMTQAEREAFVQTQIQHALDLDYIKTNGQLVSYLALSAYAKAQNKPVNVENNSQIKALLENRELKTSEQIAKGKALL